MRDDDDENRINNYNLEERSILYVLLFLEFHIRTRTFVLNFICIFCIVKVKPKPNFPVNRKIYIYTYAHTHTFMNIRGETNTK